MDEENLGSLGLPVDQMHHYFWDGYWDGPINGWLYVRGQFYYYDCLGEALIFRHRLYGVYYVPKAARVPHLLKHRSFCHGVGWHCNRRPGGERRFFSSESKPDYKAWYDAQKTLPPLEQVSKKLMVGVTTLRNGAVHWFDNPADFDREWHYIDDDDDDCTSEAA